MINKNNTLITKRGKTCINKVVIIGIYENFYRPMGKKSIKELERCSSNFVNSGQFLSRILVTIAFKCLSNSSLDQNLLSQTSILFFLLSFLES